MISLEQSFILNSFSDTEYLPMSFTWIEPGGITLGHQRFQNEDDESSMGWPAPPFPTRITKGYWIAKYPITNAHWSIITKEKILENPDYPRIQVSWIVAMQFCKQLNHLYSKELPEGYHFSLPTELHWEYACRAGTNTLNYLSDKEEDLVQVAQLKITNYYDHIIYLPNSSAPVGEKQPNKFGLHDMLGGALEWCFDITNDYPIGEDFDITDWMGQKYQDYWALELDPISPETYEGLFRILRGANWSAFRLYSDADSKFYQTGLDTGFRPCLRPITEWDLKDPLLKKEGIHILGD